ncbi:phage tail protein [Mucilaginibacter dorajii]|uniref:Tail fiber protein n=1 Tax=Mucilaginibacter dorajii TaxID=692994 RepID=A0ABP7QYB4_9SPHI|nr:tail fiber protein [Mucilaginibacter dorajii]MCS3732492.1 microcystin-dependent protein [Mucilaginibacter dorajii]
MDPYIAEIRMFAGTYAPQGWATCDGQIMSIAQNNALFALIGTTYGGDGVQTFALPDLRSRAPIHAGQGRGLSSYVQGQTGGSESVNLSQQQLPAHSHLVNGVSTAANQSTPGGFFPALSNDPAAGTLINSYSDAKPDQQMNATTISLTGGNQPVATLSPVLAVTFIIALNGIWPPRP